MIHIGIFGRRNSGKSSIINLLTEQNLSIVSDIAGTTTDPVKKRIEIFGFGPSVIIDTAGIDDEGDLGLKRVEKSLKVIREVDCAILVFDNNSWTEADDKLAKQLEKSDVPFFILHNKSDLNSLNETVKSRLSEAYPVPVLDFSTKSNANRELLIDTIKKISPASRKVDLLEGLVQAKDIVLLITPIDSEAPTGRMILPQVQMIRAILDQDAIVVDCKPEQLSDTLNVLKQKPALTITDSQVFGEVAKLIPADFALTSFSILLARQKGDFENYLKGTTHISKLRDGDKILILESCTHQTSCEDIGRVKLPKLLRKFTSKDLDFDFVSGLSSLPENISDYALVIQCGACMITQKQLHQRLRVFTSQNIPVTNYGMALAYVNGIFERATQMF